MIKEKGHIYTTTPKKEKEKGKEYGQTLLATKQPSPHGFLLLLPFSLNPDFVQVFWDLLQVKLLSDSEG